MEPGILHFMLFRPYKCCSPCVPSDCVYILRRTHAGIHLSSCRSDGHLIEMAMPDRMWNPDSPVLPKLYQFTSAKRYGG